MLYSRPDTQGVKERRRRDRRREVVKGRRRRDRRREVVKERVRGVTQKRVS